MRDVPAIWEAWKTAAQVGAARPATRVTVERNWQLQTSAATVGLWANGPARWFQRENNSQIETEIPNLVSVNISRSIDGDGQCDIVLANVDPGRLGQVATLTGQFGDNGYYTWDHGRSQESRARWGHSVNAWNDVLVPNALIRTYQGYGGHDKSVRQAVADSHVVLNGVWLVDDVNINTDGTISIKCRDMMKLLVDQQLFPPLVPLNLYPLLYQRWITKQVAIPKDPVVPGSPAGDYCNPCRYLTSSTDVTYGQANTGATGHAPAEAFDISGEVGPPVPGFFAHQRSYWLSEPKGGPGDSVWIEFQPEGGLPGDVNQIYFHAWEGNYRVMVSVMENGTWVPAETTQGGITPDGVPYVGTFTPVWEGGPIPGENSNRYPLPRDFRATKIRLTITNLSGAAGGWRAGARKIMACYSWSATDAHIPPLTFVGAPIPVGNSRLGYWQIRANGLAYAFGDARVYPPNSPSSQPASTVIGMAVHPQGNGYWYVDITGRVVSAGDAQHFGDLHDPDRDDVVDIAPTPTGNGYWLLRTGGHIHSFGDAVDQGVGTPTGTMPSGAAVIARSLESTPDDQGYWILLTDGTVQAFGAAVHYGNATRDGFTTSEYVASIRRTSTGAGYWITSGNGIVQARGDAPHKGNASAPGTNYGGSKWYLGLCWELIPSPVNDNSYAIQRADGKLEIYGGALGELSGLAFGSVGAGSATLRYDGNYKDYADIVRELLLWAGFLLYKNPQPDTEMPDIYGNIDYTGAWAEEKLPTDMFDKKPVLDAIRELRDIVGYAFWIDAEGGARFESPNWWTMGNFLIDGTPFTHMPEVDEAVNLTGHSITFSGTSARSEIIIATESPYPKVNGQEGPKGITQTRIIPANARDLRGLVVPAMWTNQKFLNPIEQHVMAELIDMRMWFSRRMGQITCLANPLIDINDQIRVIERQTGEVYVHYIKGISFSHDIEAGEFTMDLDTHWLGGSPFGRLNYFMAGAMMPGGHGYWQIANNGDVYAYGEAQIFERHQSESHLGWVTGFQATPSGNGYYSVDQYGKVLTYGDAVHRGNANPTTQPEAYPASVPINDMALTPSGNGYWLLEQNGVVHCFGDAIFYGQTNNGGRTIGDGTLAFAAAIEAHPVTQGYWILWSDGHVDNFNLPDYGSATPGTNEPNEVFMVLRRTPTGTGYYIASGGGDNVQAFGDAVYLGAADQMPDNEWVGGLVWEILIDPDGGYALQRANGALEPFGFSVASSVEVAPVQAFWALVPEDDAVDSTLTFGVSAELMNFLEKTASPSANNAVANKFGLPSEDTMRGTG